MAGFQDRRAQLLRGLGQRREQRLHRPPEWCMDPMASGSALFPPRLLADEWFTENELMTLRSLEVGLAQTGHAAALARDLASLVMFDIEVCIILDDSGSMGASMFGPKDTGGGGWTQSRISRVFADRAFAPDSLNAFADCPLSPSASRWAFAQDAVMQWELVFSLLGLQPHYWRLSNECEVESGIALFSRPPSGRASVSDTFRHVLQDMKDRDNEVTRTQLILVLTDGEAVDKADFSSILDEVQDGIHGDIQVCLVGLNLEPQGLEWFDDEECEATRIRTIRPWEVEQQQMLWRKVIERPSQYSFALHTMRALVTNLFPADYDYKALLQSLRHRLYSTLSAADRRITGTRDAAYMAFGSDACIVPVMEGFWSLLGGGQRSPRGPASTVTIEVASETAMIEDLCSEQLKELMAALRPRDATPGRIDRSTLSLLQQALAVLQPGEMVCRDLKFCDPNRNLRALRRAVGYLKRAAQGQGRRRFST
uniref:VWFA domain-containing protein n=1 Tax=Pyrodinium bahamense TaxID=73915 RepID=A0A7S0ADV4_9DINO